MSEKKECIRYVSNKLLHWKANHHQRFMSTLLMQFIVLSFCKNKKLNLTDAVILNINELCADSLRINNNGVYGYRDEFLCGFCSDFRYFCIRNAFLALFRW